MATIGEMLKEFHTVYNAANNQILLDNDLLKLRLALITEENREFDEAVENYTWAVGDLHNFSEEEKTILRQQILKELVDVVYVLVGFATTYGMDFDEAFKRVHESNMSKLGDDGLPIRRADGKVLKGPNYKPANLEGLV